MEALKDIKNHLIPDSVMECVNEALTLLDDFKYDEAKESIKNYLTGENTGI